MVQPLNRTNIAQMGTSYLMHQAVIPAGDTIEDALKPEYWELVSKHVNQYDEIRLLAEDGSFMARTLVIFKHPRFLTLRLLEAYEFDTQESVIAQDGDLSVHWKGPALKHCIMRGEDILEKEIPRKADALLRMESLTKALAA